jgi:tetratricopeptide (TPR) repeat protein
MRALWERVVAKGHSVVLGGSPPDVPDEFAIDVIRVSCKQPGGPLEPLHELQHKAEAHLGKPTQLLGWASDRIRNGLRERVLGEGAGLTASEHLALVLNRLAHASPRPCAVLIDHAESASDELIVALRPLMCAPGWVELPIVVVCRSERPGQALARLIEEMVAAESGNAVFRVEGELARAGTHSLDGLSQESLRVLRGGAVIGERFEVTLLAALLGLDPVLVLEHLQAAADAGIPIEDDGEGRLHIPESARRAALLGTLPSLTQAWHRRLASMLGADRWGREPAPRLSVVEPDGEGDGGAEVGGTERDAEPGVTEGQPDPAPRRVQPPVELSTAASEARAGWHLESAGLLLESAQRYLNAARLSTGAHQIAEGLSFCDRAQQLLTRLPADDRRRLLQAEAMGLMARFQWAAGGAGPAFTLASALDKTLAARALVEDLDAPPLKSELLMLAAHIRYDIGDGDSLDTALEELTQAIRILEGAGDPLGAASLLNDQAAVWMRLGDPVRAYHLLEQSRAVFADEATLRPSARVELAETDHLIARLPLQVRAKEGREEDSIHLGVQHALSADRAYAELGMERERGRVWETLGRLHVLAGDCEEAVRCFQDALAVLEAHSDVLGLARTVEGMAQALGMLRRPSEALALLSSSLDLNVAKGSPRGIAYLRRTLDALLQSECDLSAPEVARAAVDLDARLSDLESIYVRGGRPILPLEV